MNNITSTTLSSPQSLYLDTNTNPDGTTDRTLYVFYKEDGVLTKKTFNVVVGQRIHLSVTEDNNSITITENSPSITYKKVEAKINFERSTSPNSGWGTIQGGFFHNKDSNNNNCNCKTYIEGHTYNPNDNTTADSEYTLLIEKPNRLMVAIIGVDDIRARSDNKYMQTYSLEQQQLSFMLEYIGEGPDTRILIEYGKS